MSLPEINDLSEREQDILRLVATGAGNKQIAAQLFISTNTVKVHLRNIFAKIGVASRTEAAMTAIRLGLVQSTAAETANGLVSPEVNRVPADTPSLTKESLSPQSVLIEGNLQPIPDEAQALSVSRRLNRRLIWLLGAGSVALVVILVIFSISLARRQTARPQVSLTPAPRITPLPRWQARTGMPSARTGLAVVAYDDRLYAIGGESADGVTGAVERYDPDANTWETLLTKPLPVADIQAAVIGGKIYVPGGRTISGELIRNLEIFDPGMNRWEQGADLPTALSAYTLTAFEGRLYLFGGWDGAQVTSLAYAFDPRLNSWTALTPMPTGRELAGAALAGGKIYVVGGKDGQAGLTVVEVYSPDREGRENPWRSAAPMPAGRYGMGISSVADIIYMVGGQGQDDSPQQSLAYSPQTDVWQTFEIPPVNLGNGLGLASSGAYLYAVGGKTGTALLGDILAYQVVYTVGIPVIIK
jgi:DNA-binding CsgD family transcriptional regulator/N-acetylneuraminic acid mutarotase